MFNLFKKKSPSEKLMEQYKKLMTDAHKLSSTDRKASDQKTFEAQEILKQIDALVS
jgi:hypothetical protein